MPFVPQNFVEGTSVLHAAFMNNVDQMVNDTLGGVPTVPAVVAALGLSTAAGITLPLPVAEGGTGSTTAAAALSALGVVNFNYEPSAQEIAASVVPVNLTYPWGHVVRYGADPTGVADSTVAINNALLAATIVYAPGGTYTCSAPLIGQSGGVLYGDGMNTTFQFANGGLTNISCSGVTNFTMRDFRILVTGTGNVGKYAGVYLLNSSRCVVERVVFAGMNWSGVWLDAASYRNTVRSCFFGNFSEPAGLGGDIIIYSSGGGGTVAPSYNIIESNFCYGGGGYGVAIQDPYAATVATGFPTRNIVSNNRIGQHLTYGLLQYMPGALPPHAPPATDSFNTFIGNYVENIVGAVIAGSGMGIYSVGLGSGGFVASNNTVYNCCTGTTSTSLPPAGITLNGVPLGVTRPLITNNVVSYMPQGDGICVSTSPGGAVVVGNTVLIGSNNNGTGPGLMPLLGTGIRVAVSQDVTVENNQVNMYGNGSALFIYATGANCTRINITGGSYTAAGTGYALQIAQSGGFLVQQIQGTGARFNQTNGGAYDALNMSGVFVGQFSNCTGNTVGGVGLNVGGCQYVRFSGGQYTSQAGTNVATSGVCTSSFLTKDVNIGITTGATGSVVSNAGTGFNIEQNFSSNPTAGTWVLGDRAVHLGVTVGTAKAWARVTTGSSNSLLTDWISEGNL